MPSTYETKRTIAVWLARAWAVAATCLIFSFMYFGLVWLVAAWGYEPNRLYIAAFAIFAVALNSHELVGDLLRAFRYPAVKK